MARTRGRGQGSHGCGRGRGVVVTSPPKETLVMMQEAEYDVGLLVDNMMGIDLPSDDIEPQPGTSSAQNHEGYKAEGEDIVEVEKGGMGEKQSKTTYSFSSEEDVADGEGTRDKFDDIVEDTNVQRRKDIQLEEDLAEHPDELYHDDLNASDLNASVHVRFSDNEEGPPAKRVKSASNIDVTAPAVLASEIFPHKMRAGHRSYKAKRNRFFKPGVFATAWSLQDKQLLLEAMHVHGYDNPVKIQKAIPHKDILVVKEMLYKLAGNAKRKARESVTTSHLKSTAAIEGWVDMCTALSHTVPDYSWTICKVISMLKCLEHHDPSVKEHMPDYERLYAYIQNILSPVPTINMPKLSLVEAAVMLDLIEDLTQTLKGTVTVDQLDLMTWKAGPLLEIAKEQVPGDHSVAHVWRLIMQTFPDKSVFEAAKRKTAAKARNTSSTVECKAEDDEVAAINSAQNQSKNNSEKDQSNTSLNERNIDQSAASSESTNPTTPLSKSTNQGTASSELINQIDPNTPKASSSSNLPADHAHATPTTSSTMLDVSQPQFTALMSPKSSTAYEVLEVDGVKINMKLKDAVSSSRVASLYSINPFAIPVEHLKPFRTNPEPIAILDSEKLDRILVTQKSRKGSGPLPMHACVKKE